MLKPLNHTHLKEATALLKNVVAAMEANGLNQWDEHYPTQQHILTDIENRHAYGYFIENTLTGYVALNELYDVEYKAIEWHTHPPFLIVHRLSIHPNTQGQGIGKKCMLAIETFAKHNNYKAIRLDTYIPNIKANKLYNGLGYNKTGIVQFRKGLFYCYEKEL
ncbi:GNAT family N-acetyltransferase [Neptunitalea lumnitzerae]|uniref:N-acetyltransferase n=1 Tax=Neptunitalea lumnitzerae TaxID=2965509 RepID=A0ABQ5MEV8_9FLAO|nr:GNAT family N-acetyltransferase [Neptunitalea sp. Y10]GLB47944.1 N-acetyltransferase [Neptunitalea sp. Y10]